MSRSGRVFYGEIEAGIFKENEEGFWFEYSEKYLNSVEPQAIAFCFPLQKGLFFNKTMFPFFDGLIPEGWLLDIAVSNWKINPRDRMGLLLSVCKDCIGAVSIKTFVENES